MHAQMVVEATALGIYGTDLKNLMERFIQQIKDRTENVFLTTTFHAGNQIVTGAAYMSETG